MHLHAARLSGVVRVPALRALTPLQHVAVGLGAPPLTYERQGSRSEITVEQEMEPSAAPIAAACSANANSRAFQIVVVLILTLKLKLKPQYQRNRDTAIP